MSYLKVSRTLVIVVALAVSLAANATFVVGGILYHSVDAFLEGVTGLQTASIKKSKEVKKLKKEKRRLQKRLDVVRTKALPAAKRTIDRRITSVKKSVATLPGKAVPVLGAAVSLGFTTREIVNLCETIKDMNSIRRAIDPSDVTDDEDVTLCSIEVPTTEQVLKQVMASPRKAWEESKNLIPDLDVPMNVPDLSFGFWQGLYDLWKDIKGNLGLPE